ncbi:MAG: hypothetical protein MK110_07740 [Fuerstiella sp.]|nr:hypothetical protein [Fuerstiella sp.]
MKLTAGFALIVFIASSVVAGEEQTAPSTLPVKEASLTSNMDVARGDLHTVGHKQNVCSKCGDVHGGEFVSRSRSSPGVLERILDIERRKNKWLLSLIGL